MASRLVVKVNSLFSFDLVIILLCLSPFFLTACNDKQEIVKDLTPQITNEPSPSPSITATATSSRTSTPTPSETPTSIKTFTPTPSPSPNPTDTATHTMTPTVRPTDTTTVTPTQTATITPTATAMPGIEPIPAGQGALVVINFIGETANIEFFNQRVEVPQYATVQIPFNPGRVPFTANTISSSAGSEAEILPDQIIVVGLRLDHNDGTYDNKAKRFIIDPYDTLIIFPATLGIPTPTPVPSPIALNTPIPGTFSLVIINFLGEPIDFDIDATLHHIPANQYLQFDLKPGKYGYSASTPATSANGEVEGQIGEIKMLGTRLHRVGPEKPLVPNPVVQELHDQMEVFDANLAPPKTELAPTPEPLTPITQNQGALVAYNYIGEELNLDVNGTLNKIPANSRKQINLPPGTYTYTANNPKGGTGGSIEIILGKYSGLGFIGSITAGEFGIFIKNFPPLLFGYSLKSQGLISFPITINP